MAERSRLSSDRIRPLPVAVAETVDAYAAGKVDISFSRCVEAVATLARRDKQIEAVVCAHNVLFVCLFNVHSLI